MAAMRRITPHQQGAQLLPRRPRRVGKAKATTATARKRAILVYPTLKEGLVYRERPSSASVSFAACVNVPPPSASYS